jgi:DOMON domain
MIIALALLNIFKIVQCVSVQYYCDGTTFCSYGAPDSSGSNIILTVHASATGWAAFGIGTQMLGASMFVGWMNSTKGGMVVSATASGFNQPTAKTVQDISIVPLSIAAPSWAKIYFSFSRPVTASPSISSTTKYIFAYSSTAPVNVDSLTTAYFQHDSVGSFSGVDFTVVPTNSTVVDGTGNTGTGSSTGQPFLKLTSTSYEQILLAHGAVMFIAWGVLPFTYKN